MIEIDFSDHFPVMFIKVGPISKEQMEIFLYECGFIENSFKFFKEELFVTPSDDIWRMIQSNEAYNKFLEIFSKFYDKYFPVRTIKIKPKRISDL